MKEFTPTNLPYIKGKDSDADIAIGGRCIEIACSGALKLGELVVVSAARTVNKSATAGNAIKRVGIVVGGDLTGMRAIADKDQYGVLTVTSANGRALIQIDGLVYTIADAAIAAAGTQLALSAVVAGRVADAGATPAVGAIVGINLEVAGAAGDLMLTLLAFA